LCFDFIITKKEKIKLVDINLNLNNFCHDDIIDNIISILYGKSSNMFASIYKKKYIHFNINVINSLSYYSYARIDKFHILIKQLINNIKQYNLVFLYDISIISLKNIIDSSLINNKYNNRFTNVVRSNKDYNLYNRITNCFIEKCNARCRFGTSKTMNELAKDKEVILNGIQFFYENKADISDVHLAEYIYTKTKICSYFPVNIAYGFYKYFNAKNVLDISAGWGDRLIAACILNINYYSADPNTCNTPYYQQMIELIGNKEKQQVITCGFEDLIINKKYDLIFSSPPFFEFEKYSDDKEQSHIKYNTQNRWIYGFLYVVIQKAWKSLSMNGHMCLYMNDYYVLSYCEKMITFCIKNLDNCKYLGVINITMMSDLEMANPELDLSTIYAQPLWIFKKIY